MTTLDAKDQAILARRDGLYFNEKSGPKVGDYVDFANGVTRRVSHVWELDGGLAVQTSAGGSWYLGEGYCSFSGGLYRAVAGTTLTYTGTNRAGAVWFFHHDLHTAHNGVYATMPFAVYQCSLDAQEI